MFTIGDIVNGRMSDGVSEVLIKLYILMHGVVSWVMFYIEILSSNTYF